MSKITVPFRLELILLAATFLRFWSNLCINNVDNVIPPVLDISQLENNIIE